MTLANGVSPSPTIDQFAEVLLQEEGARWSDIGVFLGASVAEIREIRQNYATHGAATCLIELHECLAKKGKPLTWEAVATALRRLNNNRLADSIHSNYILPAIRRALSNEESTTSTTVTAQQHQIPMDMPTSDSYIPISGVISLHIGDDVIYNVGEEGCQTLEAAMLQATELKNTRAIELLQAVGCNPEVATYNGDHAVTNVVNIRERSVDEGSSGGGVDHVCVLGRNEHIEAIVDTSHSEPECATCRMKQKQIKQLYAQTDTLQQKNKELKENGITALIMLSGFTLIMYKKLL